MSSEAAARLLRPIGRCDVFGETKRLAARAAERKYEQFRDTIRRDWKPARSRPTSHRRH
jgi:hypothetical protein